MKHGCGVYASRAPRMPVERNVRKERRIKHSMPTKTLGKRPTTHAPNLQLGSETPIAMSRMPPPAEPDSPAALNPMLVALSRSNNFAHTQANGREDIQIVIVHAHTVVPQKSSSNPAFPCSASRIKAFPSSPIKLLDSLYRDADREFVHTGGILPWPSARHVVLTNQSLGIGQTYSIFVSAPLAAIAGARATAPAGPSLL